MHSLKTGVNNSSLIKNIRVKGIALLLIWVLANSFRPMGMTYFIEPNIKTPCHDHFPEGLSQFFEQWGGYENKSEVAQVEKILNINLTVFQKYDYIDTTGKLTRHWKNIETLDDLLSKLLLKIKANPQFYTQVKHNPISVEYFIPIDSAKEARMNERQRAHDDNPMSDYPDDFGYLKSAHFQNDIKELRALLHCYRRAGATKVALAYF
jgi:hypothetical protein